MSNTAYVGNVPFDVDCAAVLAALPPGCNAQSVNLSFDPSRLGANKGFGFITFATAAAAANFYGNPPAVSISGRALVFRPPKLNAAPPAQDHGFPSESPSGGALRASNMAEKRPRAPDISYSNQPSIRPPPPGQFSLQVGSAANAGEVLPTLTNWGGGRVQGSEVLSNARLTNQQRSTIQKAVCTYFLQNKCRKGADCSYSHDAVVPKQQDMCVFHFAGKCKNGHSCLYSHDGKLQPCKFLYGRGKCEHGSNCRFSHDKPSPEALAIVQEQWKNGGIKIAKDTIESCELSASDAFMSLSSLDFKSGVWGLHAWEQFEKRPHHMAPAIDSYAGNPSTSGPREIPAKSLNVSHASVSSDSRASNVNGSPSVEAAAVQSSSSNTIHERVERVDDTASQQQQAVEQQLAEVGDGSEFWS